VLGEVTLPFSVSEGAFAVRVMGNSMRDAHIVDGDIAICDPAIEADDRSTVIALVDGDYTIKTLRRNASQEWWLEPANDQFRPILPRMEGDRVAASVVGLIRERVGKAPRVNAW
jgi:SOS-response transcriptional repressor LexA